MKNPEFEKVLESLYITKKEFTQIVGMPYQTLMNWKQRGYTPAWVGPFLHYYKKSIEYDKLMEMLSQYQDSKKG